ncbi:MAG: tetratricopeptide repeat protein [Candidatus Electrothrix sp. YB6]
MPEIPSDSPEDLQQIYAQAVAAHENGDVALAAELYSRILEHFPDADVVLYNQGLALFALNRFAEAAVAFAEAAKFRPDDPDTWFNLGLALKEEQRYAAAINAYQQASALQPEGTDILFNLANCCREGGEHEQAAEYYSRLLARAPKHEAALNNFAYLCHLQQDYTQAEELYQRLLALRPGHPGALHMLAALRGTAEQTPENEYVRDLFDRYSETFEQSLVNRLYYRVPELLFGLVQQYTQQDNRTTGKEIESRFTCCLDLGCGTGLAGEMFTALCSRLVGVDLSEKMLARAAKKGVYERLVTEEAVQFLENMEKEEQQYDLLVAADLLTYLADLEPLLRAAFARTIPSGLFAFSTEHGEEPGWQVRPTGRFAHHPDYVAETAERIGWQVISSEQAKLRREADAWIQGDLFLLTRPLQPE